MNAKSIALGCLIALVVIGVLRPLTQAAEKPSEPRHSGHEFGKGILIISVHRTAGIDSQRQSIMLQEPKLVELGGRIFVRGKGHIAKNQEGEPTQNWFKGVDAAFAWDDVAEFYVMTPEQVEKYTADLEE